MKKENRGGPREGAGRPRIDKRNGENKMTTYTVIGTLEQSGRELTVIETVSKRKAWDAFNDKIGAMGWAFRIEANGRCVFGWDRWAGKWAA